MEVTGTNATLLNADAGTANAVGLNMPLQALALAD
jgi:hypothetical protein